MGSAKALPFPAHYRKLVTRKPLDGDETEHEVRFAVYKQRPSRSKESLRKWAQGITKKRDLVWVVVSHGMLQKVGRDLYQLRGAIHGPRGRRLFEARMNERELRSLFGLDGTLEARITGLAARLKKHVMTYDPRFYFQTRKFLQDEVADLMKNGKITRPKRWQ